MFFTNQSNLKRLPVFTINLLFHIGKFVRFSRFLGNRLLGTIVILLMSCLCLPFSHRTKMWCCYVCRENWNYDAVVSVRESHFSAFFLQPNVNCAMFSFRVLFSLSDLFLDIATLDLPRLSPSSCNGYVVIYLICRLACVMSLSLCMV